MADEFSVGEFLDEFGDLFDNAGFGNANGGAGAGAGAGSGLWGVGNQKNKRADYCQAIFREKRKA